MFQFDPAVRVQDDLFRHVNGRWLETAEIKPDRATAGSFVDLADEAEAKVRSIIETAAESPQDDEQRKIGDLYASFMDEERIEALGASPLAGELAQVDAITDVPGFVTTLGVLDRQGVGSVFGMYIAPDRGQPDRYIAHLGQGGIGLPDESYYREDEYGDIRAAYVTHITTVLGLAGLDDAAGRAARIMDLETRIAAFHWDRVACRDAQKTYNLLDTGGLQSLAPSFDWASWSAGAKVPPAVLAEVVVSQPSFLEGLQTLLAAAQDSADELAAWKDWLRWQVVHSAAAYLSSDFVAANFEFYGRTLSGTDELRPRWKRGVGFVQGAMGEAVGKIYVRSEFPPASKERMTELITNLLEAYRQSITALPWMSAETKKRAHDKLDSFNPKIGHPDQFKDYSALETAPDDLLGNLRRSIAVETDRELAKIGSPIDRDEWYMTPQTVNAYYNPTMNEIVFPAAILQPPFFHADADDAVNYGAIGAVIGHEIGHGFDDQGSQYDGTGALSNWWTDDDRAAFEKLTSALIAQYDELSPAGAEGKHVNGSLTIGENIGDLGGLGIAYQAFRLTQPSDEPIDGLTPDQRFFISWAQAWQSKVRPAETLRRLAVDPHSPPEFRCNQVVRNIDAFYAAFDVTPEDGLWLDEEQRVSIW
ncbi:M13 family metallopeptidase [Aeromicrobium wangtongii]|uniref:Peptidase M13 n=1 Tax=Aeromicrobium wangtongii TaxID=2969247 RepID=A0ABY5MBJ8_9ACTN|nr:M13-type metalloendopeptidase [Aeromicrobium wangtongii]MCD9197295.1 peptidase M13 [Aeromicrobium wangtongii]UUP15488.1 peptidase M13 [Aeromicrobium wangtongii]